MTPTIHVIELARAFGVEIHTIEDRHKAYAGLHSSGLRAVFIAPVVDDETYAIALHELGHAIDPLGFLGPAKLETLRDVRLKWEGEEAAWRWARHYALRWTPAMEKCYLIAINSYRQTFKHYGVILP